MQVEDAETIVKLTEEMDSIDGALLQEAASLVKELNKELDRFELTQLLSGPYDKEGAVLYITAGAGGTDAQVIVTLHSTRRKLTGFLFLFCFFLLLMKSDLLLLWTYIGLHGTNM